AAYPAGIIGDTATNLEAAADGELLEWGNIYKEAAQVAREEGFEKVARQFDEIAKIEKHHEARYRKLLDNLNKGLVFKKDSVTVWKCRNCGFVFEGREAPQKCPACEHPQAYFEIKADNF
ncbi:unnamed protein product, partial [marine sediment metagenome]